MERYHVEAIDLESFSFHAALSYEAACELIAMRRIPFGGLEPNLGQFDKNQGVGTDPSGG